MNWKIEQCGDHEWRVSYGNEVHWAQNAYDAVALKKALEGEEKPK